MFDLFGLFRKNPQGATLRNGYLDEHGYYLAQAKKKPLHANGHSMPVIPYVVFDLLNDKLNKDFNTFIRWDIYSYRWALHTFKHSSSCRISLKKKSGSNHRHFVRDGEKTIEELTQYSKDHENRFDLILFDGPEKSGSASLICSMLKNSGIIVITDDFNDPYDFGQALAQCTACGFKSLKVTNPAPMFDSLTAAVLYKPDNFMNL